MYTCRDSLLYSYKTFLLVNRFKKKYSENHLMIFFGVTSAFTLWFQKTSYEKTGQPIVEYHIGNQPKHGIGSGLLQILDQIHCAKCFTPVSNSFKELCHAQKSFAFLNDHKVLKKCNTWILEVNPRIASPKENYLLQIACQAFSELLSQMVKNSHGLILMFFFIPNGVLCEIAAWLHMFELWLST